MLLLVRSGSNGPITRVWTVQMRKFARMTGRAGKLQHFRYGVSKVRGRWYYRYHKPIGRANWKGYQERYLKPKDVEAKQRLVFAPKATTKQLKQSLSWQWRLPRMLAAATNPNQVLDAWVLFRYRHPKKMYHYMMTLKRLVQVGGCEPTDWRLQVLIHRMRSGYKRVIGIDVLVKYLSQLRLLGELEYLTRFLRPRVSHLKSHQLETILTAFGSCNLRDSKLVGKIVRRLRALGLTGLSPRSKINLIDSLGSCGIRNSVFVSEVVSDLLKTSKLSTAEYGRLLKALAACRIRDHTVIELATDKVLSEIENGSLDSRDAVEVCYQLRNLGVHQDGIITAILDRYSPLDLPCRALIKFVYSLPARQRKDPQIHQWLDVAVESIPLIGAPSDILRLAQILDKVEHDDITAKDVWNQLAERYLSLEPCMQKFNVSELARIFQKRGVLTDTMWKRIAQDLNYSIDNFESDDLLRVLKVVGSAPEDVIGNKSTVANVVTDWSIRNRDEFNASEWATIRKLAEKCGGNANKMLDSISG